MGKKNSIVSHYLSCLGQTSCIVGQIAWVILANYGFRTLKFVN